MKPSVFIYANTENFEMVKEICAGLEEEGVLFDVFLFKNCAESMKNHFQFQTCDDLGHMADLAKAAYFGTLYSPLGSGIGIFNFTAAFQVKNMAEGDYIFQVVDGSPDEYRRLGANAGRAVKRKAFIMQD